MTNLSNTIFLTFLAPLILVGCLEDIKISPSESRINVPVNAVVRVSYFSEAFLKKSQITSKYFQLTTCPDGPDAASPEAASQNPEQKDSNAEKEKKETKPAAQGSPVDGWIIERQYDVKRTYPDGKPSKDLKRTDVIFIPRPKAVDEPPLQENTQYCFTAQPVKDQNNKLLPEITTSFTTEENSTFGFDSEAVLGNQFPNPNTKVSPNQNLIFKLFNGKIPNPVLPDDIKQGTSLCFKSGTVTGSSSADSACGRQGESRNIRLAMVEEFTEKDGISVAHYNTFAVLGSQSSMADEGEYELKVGLGSEHTGIQQRRFTFTVSNKAPVLGDAGWQKEFDRKDASYIPIDTEKK